MLHKGIKKQDGLHNQSRMKIVKQTRQESQNTIKINNEIIIKKKNSSGEIPLGEKKVFLSEIEKWKQIQPS